MKKFARIAVVLAAMSLALMSIQITTASAQDGYESDNPTVRAVYTAFRGAEAPKIVDNAFGFGSLNPTPSSDPAAGGGTAGGGNTGGGLAHTGNEVTAPLAAAAALIGGGGLLLIAARDRDRD